MNLKFLSPLFLFLIPVFCFGQQTTDSTITDDGYSAYAQFPRGENVMHEFLQKNLHYPNLARMQGIQGTVYVGFSVDSIGTIGNLTIRRGLDASLNIEAIRVCRMMPNWIPAVEKGKNVSSNIVMPIKFTLSSGGNYQSLNRTCYNDGVDYSDAKIYDMAIQSFSYCIETNIKAVDSYFNRAACYKKLNKMTEACSDWKKATELGDEESKKLLIKYCQ